MLGPAERAPQRPPLPLASLPLVDLPLGPAVMADDPCEAAFAAADPAGPRKYYRARYYDPKLGRFISEDPIGFKGGGNFYRYVDDNPVRYRDPKGLERPAPRLVPTRGYPWPPEPDDGSVAPVIVTGAVVGGILTAPAWGGAVVRLCRRPPSIPPAKLDKCWQEYKACKNDTYSYEDAITVGLAAHVCYASYLMCIALP